jgi:hydroxymethylglutaryl-CoA lyase
MNLIECPRDAMQGLHDFVPTEQKIAYLNALLQVGFHTIDFGSFVSPKAIPQLRDTAEVLAGLSLQGRRSRLLAIVANMRGVEEALRHAEVDDLGFPLSASETFQQRNTNKSIADALEVVREAHRACQDAGKRLVTYISMGFGNPYGDPYSPELVQDFVARLDAIGVEVISLADTVGSAAPEPIESLFGAVIPAFPHIEFGAHFHSVPQQAEEKVLAAYRAGCRRFDSAVGGMGGCPMAADSLTGNIATEQLLAALAPFEALGLDEAAFAQAVTLKKSIFG